MKALRSISYSIGAALGMRAGQIGDRPCGDSNPVMWMIKHGATG